MRIDFYSDIENEYDVLEDVFSRLAKKTFEKLNIQNNYLIETRLTGDELIKKINKEYRNIDKPTDVLSFAFLEGDGEIAFNKKETLLGEIIISLDTAKLEAQENNVDVNYQISFLFVHGLLHLLGYDHQKEEDAVKMFALQECLLEGENL